MAINGKHDVNDAFLSLHPTAIWSLYDYADYSTVNWISTDITIPTEEEVKAEIARLDAEWIANEYQRKRANEYPELKEQLDYIYHNGIDNWKENSIKPIKTKYPKPS